MNEEEFLFYSLKENLSAVEFCQLIFRISQILDDLVDKDKPVSDDELINLVFDCLVSVNLNPFFVAHQHYLTPLLAQHLSDWRDSTAMERSNSEHLKHVAFGLRSNVGSLITQCAFLIAGKGWADTISIKMRELIHDESLTDYLKNLEKEKNVREG